mgnify:CR=1 FL=1|tara:strand:+ start:660 stop:1028 length:369 start_codon:yes stop_codon:yes gene_type:complete
MKKYKTIFCDIDGTIFKYRKFETYESSEPEPCNGVVEKLKQWADEGHMVILTTARPEYLKDHTLHELEKYEISYNKLIMEIERGPRFLINDMDPNEAGERATGINLPRDEGFSEVSWKKMNL